MTQEEIREKAREFVAEFFTIEYVFCDVCNAENCPYNTHCINCNHKLIEENDEL